ncbi:MAG: DUF3572 domain-containing protein [Pseudomonadota bacterium]
MKMGEHQATSAQAIAIAGLARLASDDDLMMRFCALTGVLANEIRSAAQEPNFLVGVLDFYLAHEPDLIEFAEAEGLDPETIVKARHALSPVDTGEFS